MMKNVLLYFTLKYKCDWEKVYNALEAKEKVEIDDLLKINLINKNWVSIVDDEYNKNLKNVYKPPFGLFFKGNYSLMNKNKLVGLVGDFEKDELLKIKSCNKNICFVINLVNENSKLIADLLELKIPFIGVSTNGIDFIENKSLVEKITKNNLIVSEYNFENKKINTEQPSERIFVGLSEKIIFGNNLKNNIIEFELCYQIAKAENKEMFLMKKQKNIRHKINLWNERFLKVKN